MMAGLRKMWAFLARDFFEELSYPVSTFWHLGSIIFQLVTFYFLGRLVTPAASPLLADYGGGYFPFVMVGLALTSFQGVALSAVSQTVQHGMYTGTLEAMLVTPTSLTTIIVSSALYHFLYALVEILLYVVFSLAFFGLDLGPANLTAAGVMLGFTILAHLPLGIMAAAFLLVFKRGDPFTALLGHLSGLLGGVYFPVAVLPEWLQTAAQVIPFTHALEGLRQAVLNGQGVTQLGTQIAILGLFAAVLLPVSLALFAAAVHLAKRLGTLSQF